MWGISGDKIMKIKSMIALIVAVIFGVLLVYSISHAQKVVSMSEMITKQGVIEKATELKFTKDAKLVDKELREVDVDGKKVIQEVVTNDIGITVHHHWTKYPTNAITTIQVGKSRYKGVSTFDSNGNETFTVKEAPLKEVVTK